MDIMTQINYPTDFGPAIEPAHRDDLEYFTFKYGKSFWFQKNNWWMQNHKTSKSPWQHFNMTPFRILLDYRPGVIIDVGANIGMTAVQFVGWGYDVLAFEPSIQTCNLLSHNLVINGAADKVTIYQNAVSDINHEAVLRDQFDYNGTSALVMNPTPLRNKGRSEYQPITAVALDNLSIPKVAGIKIDVEGHEFAVLKGADALIKKDRPVIIVELLAVGNKGIGTKQYDWSPQDIYDYFHKLDYVVYNKKLIKQKVWKYVRDHSDHIFVPKEHQLKNELFVF